MAPVERFELSIQFTPYNRLAICRFKPLSHTGILVESDGYAPSLRDYQPRVLLIKLTLHI